jgi:phosphoglucosamine mutase
MLEELGEVEYTRVGDPFVMDRAMEVEAELAGEPNGHYSFTGFVPYNSGMLAGAILAGLDLEEYLDNIPDYSTGKLNIEVENKAEKMQRITEAVRERYDVKSEIDGVKYQADEASVLVRPSGSSSKIRIKADARNSEDIQEALDEAEALVRNA